ncbi:DUF485 domain-containing protein [Streptomyces sp. CB03911]|uniref:DUF485 domain-containing protein n=1 Tax=Streptomycetaceae TaxID=2062 RepID=UPI00093BBC66|nr:DUF485 domain-containing protein [Streptomyces sp. CB03911]OKI29178.1 hypothetical protein A6A07_23630 [Streptomyces sp. CB03911]
MSLFEPARQDPPPGSDLHDHPSHEPLRRTARRLRRRLLAVNGATALAVFLLAHTAKHSMATPMVGGSTLGMLLLGGQAVTMLVSAVRYDRACAARCDRHVDALVSAARRPGPGAARP